MPPASMIWLQNYDPLGNALLSTLVAALPVVVLLASIALWRIRIHFAALLGLAMALGVALGAYRMPADVAVATTAYGAAFGLFPIGWIILNIIFLYQLTVRSGLFAVLRDSLATVAPDPRIQIILIAFSFGAFIEGMAGFGAPVAITGAILIQLGFRPLHASCLALIANTAPVAFGSLGIPITTLEQVTGLDAKLVSAMVGRQLPFFSLLIPFWVVTAFAGWRGMLGVWPAAMVAGVAFAVPQFLISNFHGPWLVDIGSGACSIGATVLLMRFWRPKTLWKLEASDATVPGGPAVVRHGRGKILLAWTPWVILSVSIFLWGSGKKFLQGKASLSGAVAELRLPAPASTTNLVLNPRIVAPEFKMPGLHGVVQRVPPVAPPDATPEKAVITFDWLAATGTGILVAAILAGLAMGLSPREMLSTYGQIFWRVRYSLLTIAGMLALGNVTKFSGTDATLGLAMAKTGVLYPFFGTLLGWLGVALTGSDTSSNVLFGSLQKITSEQMGLSPVLMGAANSAGGVMGKMVDAQSIVVASTATNWYGHEGDILRYVFFHSIALAVLMGLLVFCQAYVPPFTSMVVR